MLWAAADITMCHMCDASVGIACNASFNRITLRPKACTAVSCNRSSLGCGLTLA